MTFRSQPQSTGCLAGRSALWRPSTNTGGQCASQVRSKDAYTLVPRRPTETRCCPWPYHQILASTIAPTLRWAGTFGACQCERESASTCAFALHVHKSAQSFDLFLAFSYDRPFITHPPFSLPTSASSLSLSLALQHDEHLVRQRAVDDAPPRNGHGTIKSAPI